jgi:hypothetical protein
MVNYSDIHLIFFSLLQRAKQNYNEIARIIPDSFGTCKLTVVAGCGTGYDFKKKLNIVYKNTNFIQLIYSLLHTLESKNTPVAIAFVLGRTEKNSIQNKMEEDRKTNKDVIQKKCWISTEIYHLRWPDRLHN